MRKILFMALTFSIALLHRGPIEQLIAQNQSYGNVAWAQDVGDSEQADDASTEPAMTPPDLQGTWSGPVDDDSGPMATLTLEIFQNHSKLKGTWSVANASGKFKGKISSDGTSAVFTLKGHHGCKVTTLGTLDSATEISGTYKSKHCEGITSGSFDLTAQP